MSAAFQCLSCARTEHFLLTPTQSLTLPFQRKLFFCSLPLSSRARNLSSSIVAASSKKKKNKKKLSRHHVTEGGEEDMDAFELLFNQLEQDLKRGDLSDDDGEDEITEEEMALLERELENALGDFDAELLNSDVIDVELGSGPENDDEDGDRDGDDGESQDGDENPVNLKNWQMKKLARALKAGRRKTSIKNLAADLCLDRALVLQLLREPPPNLLMMSLTIPDEPATTVVSLETKPSEILLQETSIDQVESEPEAKVPVHTLQRNWYAQKRLKKVHVDTLERVYRKSKRPTNAMISSIVHVTNIPRKRVVKWFEDKRAEEGVPDHRLPYQRYVPETA
ncbi:protein OVEREXPRESSOR OF CATIONIC PEROXIDASE 3 [Vigna umbellata]|uniref:protein OVEREXPRESSOR OF CATIONIC PEROXIDASE 3 n=1 Tax=Vigna umbellata TaxID=87088 RepID=UPI001F5FD8A5|nr:protein OVEREXPRESSOR OF CATIONIC PEROXIDASE 3 [Vigna umbellata]